MLNCFHDGAILTKELKEAIHKETSIESQWDRILFFNNISLKLTIDEIKSKIIDMCKA